MFFFKFVLTHTTVIHFRRLLIFNRCQDVGHYDGNVTGDLSELLLFGPIDDISDGIHVSLAVA